MPTENRLFRYTRQGISTCGACIREMSSAGRLGSIKTPLVCLAAIAALAATTMGCRGPLADRVASADVDPFFTDRVVEVQLVMAEGEWDALLIPG